MALETGDYIADLVITNPAATDVKSQGDDHLRLIKEAVKQTFPGFAGAVLCTGTNGGAADAYTLTPTVALVSYVSPMVIAFAPTANNTGASTMNVSGLGAKDLKSVVGANLGADELVAGRWYFAIYDGTNFQVDTVSKQYVDQLAFGTALPAQAGNAGKYVKTDGSNASWDTISLSDTSDGVGLAIAFATAL